MKLAMSNEQRLLSLLGTQGMKKGDSSLSISTRVTSSESLCDLDVDEPVPEKAEFRRGDLLSVLASFAKANLSSRKTRLLCLAAAAAMYVWWSRYVNRMSHRPSSWGPKFAAKAVAALLSGLAWCIGVRGIKDVVDEPSKIPDRQLMVTLHPHGLCGMGPLLLHGNEPRRVNGPMENVYILAADACFGIPGLREVMLLINARAATAQVVEEVLCSGASVAVFPGGIHEQLHTDHAQEKLFFPPNLGFLRQAIKHGVPLVPMYSFGENQQFEVPQWTRTASAFLKEKFGVGMPFPGVKKRFQFQCRLGRVVEVGPADANPSHKRVLQLFRTYCAELHRLFDEHKDSALPAAVAARGLQLIWRGHESEDLSSGAVQDSELARDNASTSVVGSTDSGVAAADNVPMAARCDADGYRSRL